MLDDAEHWGKSFEIRFSNFMMQSSLEYQLAFLPIVLTHHASYFCKNFEKYFLKYS